MTHENFITYENYKAKFLVVKINLDKKQILKDAELIKAADEGR